MATIKAPAALTSASLPLPRWIDVVYLDDGNAQSYTVPSDVEYAIFSADDAVWVRASGTASVPAADNILGTGSLRIPTTGQFRVESGGTISIIRENASTTIVSIGCYS